MKGLGGAVESHNDRKRPESYLPILGCILLELQKLSVSRYYYVTEDLEKKSLSKVSRPEIKVVTLTSGIHAFGNSIVTFRRQNM